jgi:DNA modification methylase
MLAPPQRPKYQILTGDCRTLLKRLPDQSVNCCVTSPPYFGLRDYNVAGQIGLEQTPANYVAEMVDVFGAVHRVLRDDGTFWLNIGDSYAGSWGAQSRQNGNDLGSTLEGSSMLSARQIKAHPKGQTKTGSLKNTPGLKNKDLIGIPWRTAFALQNFGWYLRDAIIWAKPNGMPGSQQDRCTSSYEMVFHFSKSERYWSDFDAIKTPPRESTMVRTAQNVQAQAGSHRANGGAKINGPMKAVGGKTDKQRGHGRQHEGFNDRWDEMKKTEQQARPATMRNVWFVSPCGYPGAHFAVMPEEIARRCILAGCPEGGIVLDPFGGAGTTGLVATRNNRRALLIELNPAYATLAANRIKES